MLNLKVILFLVFFKAIESGTLPDSSPVTSCMTANNDTGVCVELKKCSILTNKDISGSFNLTDFIRYSRCGPQSEILEEMNVCCGIDSDDYLNQENQVDNVSPAKHQKTAFKDPLPKTCGNQSHHLVPRIFGGTTTLLGEFPWMARLRFRDGDGVLTYGCSGFLISERFVLTAAHCFRFKRLGLLYQVQLGEYNTEEDPDCHNTSRTEKQCADPPQLLRTDDPIMHPAFTNNIDHHDDIAVIPLKQPATLTKFVYPICLSTNLSEESEMWVSGWGETESSKHCRRKDSPVKLKVAIQRTDWNDCADAYSTENVTILKSQICAGNVPGGDSCKGDSGGPIMVQKGSEPWHAEGIISFGMGCGLEEWPGVYTSIPYYVPWIRGVMNEFLRNEL